MGVNWPADGPYVVARYQGNSAGRTIEFTASIGPAKEDGAGKTVFRFIVASTTFQITPPIDSTNPLSAGPLQDVFKLYDRIQGQVIGKVVGEELEVPKGTNLPTPLALVFVAGVSLVLKTPGGRILTRAPRDNQFDYSYETEIESIKTIIRSNVNAGQEKDDEDNYEFTDARSFAVLTQPQRLHFVVFYHVHRFLGGDAGCNWLFCWDYREWAGAKDDVPIDIQFSTVLQGADLQVKPSLINFNYEVPDNAIYLHGNIVGSVRGLIVPIAKAVIQSKINALVGNFQADPIPVPLPPAPAMSVGTNFVALSGAGGMESLRINVNFV